MMHGILAKRKQLWRGQQTYLENDHDLSKKGVNIFVMKFYIHRIQLAPLEAPGRLVNTDIEPLFLPRFQQ